MEMNKKLDGNTLTVALKGRLDTTTAPGLETELRKSVPDIQALVLDFSDLEYISSAGLRALVYPQKELASRGGMKIVHANEMIMEVFEITGFTDILTIE